MTSRWVKLVQFAEVMTAQEAAEKATAAKADAEEAAVRAIAAATESAAAADHLASKEVA